MPDLCDAIGRDSPLPMAAVQEVGHVVRYANRAFYRLTEKTEKEVIGRPFTDVAPANDQCRALLDRVYRTGEPETLIEQDEGSPDSVSWSYSMWPISTHDGCPTGIMVQVVETTAFHRQAVKMNEALMLANIHQHELTEASEQLSDRLRDEIRLRKRREAALSKSEKNLRELSRSLEQRVAERTAQLVEQAARLRRLAAQLVSAEQRERKHLAAILHDDLQQLLVAAGMDLSMVKKRMREQDDIQALERAATHVGEASRAARELTSQLRPPALYEEGFVAALHWLASETRDLHRVQVNITGTEPTERISDEFNALLFDCVRELLLNIVKYAGVKEATVSVREEGNCLRVEIEDEGRGFDVDAAAHEKSSSGFGLFSIRERLLALGGDISIESNKGKGTHIQLEVPLSIAASGRLADMSTPVEARKKEPPRRIEHQAVRILIVDDHAMVRQGLATIIGEDERLTVVGEASNGLDAIEVMEKNQPDVVLIDVNMPRMNGIEATREICRRWPESIVIGLSVQSDETTANLMRTAGAKAFLSKDGDADHLIATIIALQVAAE